ncbi:hypothetical protein NLU13_3757 [Sarocladium strictum]|uniref:Uncharacterized protein n=1 Tax=Sarocladium strictum TaxID=5046 RepID=A0AA39L7L0_SARSR|nr:hypothetical protein NLU13_3757 [Sarocladium strictum]
MKEIELLQGRCSNLQASEVQLAARLETSKSEADQLRAGASELETKLKSALDEGTAVKQSLEDSREQVIALKDDLEKTERSRARLSDKVVAEQTRCQKYVEAYQTQRTQLKARQEELNAAATKDQANIDAIKEARGRIDEMKSKHDHAMQKSLQEEARANARIAEQHSLVESHQKTIATLEARLSAKETQLDVAKDRAVNSEVTLSELQSYLVSSHRSTTEILDGIVGVRVFKGWLPMLNMSSTVTQRPRQFSAPAWSLLEPWVSASSSAQSSYAVTACLNLYARLNSTTPDAELAIQAYSAATLLCESSQFHSGLAKSIAQRILQVRYKNDMVVMSLWYTLVVLDQWLESDQPFAPQFEDRLGEDMQALLASIRSDAVLEHIRHSKLGSIADSNNEIGLLLADIGQTPVMLLASCNPRTLRWIDAVEHTEWAKTSPVAHTVTGPSLQLLFRPGPWAQDVLMRLEPM